MFAPGSADMERVARPGVLDQLVAIPADGHVLRNRCLVSSFGQLGAKFVGQRLDDLAMQHVLVRRALRRLC